MVGSEGVGGLGWRLVQPGMKGLVIGVNPKSGNTVCSKLIGSAFEPLVPEYPVRTGLTCVFCLSMESRLSE